MNNKEIITIAEKNNNLKSADDVEYNNINKELSNLISVIIGEISSKDELKQLAEEKIKDELSNYEPKDLNELLRILNDDKNNKLVNLSNFFKGENNPIIQIINNQSNKENSSREYKDIFEVNEAQDLEDIRMKQLKEDKNK